MRLLSDTHLYTRTAACISFLRQLPKSPATSAPQLPHTFHTYWYGPFGAKQTLSLKSFLATQDPSRSRLCLWLDDNSNFHDRQNNPYLAPLLNLITVKKYDPLLEAAGTPFAHSPLVEHAGSIHRTDIFRTLILTKYGGTYFDVDVLFLRDFVELLPATAGLEFCYQWAGKPWANSAVLRLDADSEISKYLAEKGVALRNCLPWKLYRMDDPQLEILMLPSTFFDPLWLMADGVDSYDAIPISAFQDFFRPIDARDMEKWFGVLNESLRGCFAYHWHSRWASPEWRNSLAGSFNQLFDTILNNKFGIRARPSFQTICPPDGSTYGASG